MNIVLILLNNNHMLKKIFCFHFLLEILHLIQIYIYLILINIPYVFLFHFFLLKDFPIFFLLFPPKNHKFITSITTKIASPLSLFIKIVSPVFGSIFFIILFNISPEFLSTNISSLVIGFFLILFLDFYFLV